MIENLGRVINKGARQPARHQFIQMYRLTNLLGPVPELSGSKETLEKVSKS